VICLSVAVMLLFDFELTAIRVEGGTEGQGDALEYSDGKGEARWPSLGQRIDLPVLQKNRRCTSYYPAPGIGRIIDRLRRPFGETGVNYN
jgi:hypothetical protein